MCKLHGVRFIKRIKIFESMLTNLPLLLTKRLGVSSQHEIVVVLLLHVCSSIREDIRLKNSAHVLYFSK